ncbi:MAG: LptE family protein [candidate division WOR-3 bacterium]|nr:LptE family protein [candidate division WOR-3 bacterium]
MRFLALGYLLLVAGCCGYSTRSLLPSHLKTVAVPPATNTTTQPGLAEALTVELTAAFTSDRTLHVTNAEAADLIVNTTVSSYSRTASSYTGDQVVSAYELSVSAQVQARDQTRDEEFYSGTASARVTYDPNAKTEEQAAADAVKKLASEVVRQVQIAW